MTHTAVGRRHVVAAVQGCHHVQRRRGRVWRGAGPGDGDAGDALPVYHVEAHVRRRAAYRLLWGLGCVRRTSSPIASTLFCFLSLSSPLAEVPAAKARTMAHLIPPDRRSGGLACALACAFASRGLLSRVLINHPVGHLSFPCLPPPQFPLSHRGVPQRCPPQKHEPWHILYHQTDALVV